MKFLRLCALPVVLAASSAAYAQQSPYVDPALRALLAPATPALRGAPAFGVAVRRTTPLETPRVGVFAKLRDETAVSELLQAGARIGSRVGSIVTAEVPIDRLPVLLTSTHFEMFEASREVSVTNDSSMKVIRADAVRRASGGTWTGTAGRNVIVGVYDTGLDFTHDDFLDPSGNTRVLGIWDQTLSQTGIAPPAGFSYGFFCTRQAIQQVINNQANALPCPQTDSNGHGTHVAGTAAGDGSAVGAGGTPFTFAGVAPLADLMIVKGGNGLFSESSIIDGLVFLERQARQLNRPMVVNLSLGGQAGPHDGSRLYEAIVDSLSRPGFIVVFSSGNDGSNANDKNPDGTTPPIFTNYIHGSGPAGGSRDFTIEIAAYAPSPGACNDFVNLSLWYEAQDAVDVTILRPDGGIVSANAGQVKETDSTVGNVRIDNGSHGPNTGNNAVEADIRINDCGPGGAAPAMGMWTLRVSMNQSVTGKPFHFWMYAQDLGGALVAHGRTGFDNHYVVSSPGNARSAITVGAFVTKTCWNSPAKPDGPVCFVTREDIGDIARFSSAGPTRDGRLKPEITAPGLGIASARSRFSFPAANRILADGVHWINQGTSMAAPHVTGAIAVLFENNPTLTAQQVKDAFSRASDHDAFTARVYDTAPDSDPRYWWGFGKLNVCAALSSVGTIGGGGTGPVAITPRADTLPVNATTRFFSCSATGAAIAFTSSNPSVATIDAAGIVRALQIGTARLIATSGTFADTAVVVVTAPANLGIRLRDVAPTEPTRGPRGTRLPLLATTLSANGFEPIRVTQLSYRVNGIDPNAHFVLVADANRNGIIDFGERTIASKPVSLNNVPVVVDMTMDSLIVPQRDSVNLIAAIELSGAAPNQTSFSAEFLPGSTRTTGTRSLATNRVDPATGTLASSNAVTTLLEGSTVFAMSENPVRTGRVVFSFSQTPQTARIYTLTGRLVSDLRTRLATPGSVIWDLTNDDGKHIASGVYIVAFDFGFGIVRQKLFVIAGAQ